MSIVNDQSIQKHSSLKKAMVSAALLTGTVSATGTILSQSANADEVQTTATKATDANEMTGKIAVNAKDIDGKIIDTVTGTYTIAKDGKTATFTGQTKSGKKISESIPVTMNKDVPNMDLSGLLKHLTTTGYTLVNNNGDIKSDKKDSDFTVTVNYNKASGVKDGKETTLPGTGTKETTPQQKNDADKDSRTPETKPAPKPEVKPAPKTDDKKTEVGKVTDSKTDADAGATKEQTGSSEVKNDNKIPLSVIPNYSKTYGKVKDTKISEDGFMTRINYEDGHYSVTRHSEDNKDVFETRVYDKNDKQVGDPIFTNKDSEIVDKDGHKKDSTKAKNDKKDDQKDSDKQSNAKSESNDASEKPASLGGTSNQGTDGSGTPVTSTNTSTETVPGQSGSGLSDTGKQDDGNVKMAIVAGLTGIGAATGMMVMKRRV